eukprot:CAMPEP_0170246778 /NCGR_PEP_ID=MMETSP0116_2-20130129/23176_1 /TAXON_ID=400756 /ORGANISM="Durinskia baltica, Strain CSIRO CS-38" /LENGTH=408 /DNA_ID=CAMNT_0010497655 /DNA_START=91 /DNA_END=1317 /DNA_ORIENTATION=+
MATPLSPTPAGSFVKYDKMELGSGLVGAAATTDEANRYVVTEKVHGANFCVIASFTDNDSSQNAPVSVKFAKRTAVIGGAEDGEDFFSCRSVGLLRALAPRAELALRRLAQDGADAEGNVRAVHIYGELFGGAYPHPEVDVVDGLRPVQKGVWYSPSLEFIGFDMAVERASADGCGSSRSFLDFSYAKSTCEACGFLFVQPLCSGSLAECLEFDYEFETTIPPLLGLPALPLGAAGGGDGRNLAEGVVVRPAREPRSLRGSRSSRGARGLFKRKIAAFSESQYQNNDWRQGKAGGGGAGQIGEESLVEYEIIALVTQQRLANVLSKTGRVDSTDRAACRALLQAFKDDVVEDMAAGDVATLRRSPTLAGLLDRLCRKVITCEFAPARRASLPSAAGISASAGLAAVRS